MLKKTREKEKATMGERERERVENSTNMSWRNKLLEITQNIQ